MKIEVGKKYVDSNGIVEIIANIETKNFKNTFIGHHKERDYITKYLEDGYGINGDNLIKEYKQPFKNEITGWIGCSKSETLADNSIGSQILKCNSSDYLNTKEEDVHRTWNNRMHVKITVEEIID